jgi:septum formation protein
LSELILGSGSPRRASILGGMGVDFIKRTADIDERQLAEEQPVPYVCRLAESKARKVLSDCGDGDWLVLGADTIVTIDGELLGKPIDSEHALQMLTRLSARTHEVITAFSLCDSEGGCVVHHETTHVTFRSLQTQEIDEYIASGSPMDKAGAYGIQDGAGEFVQSVDGSFSNVVGLPVESLVTALTQLGVIESGLQARLSTVRGRVAAAQGEGIQTPTLVAVSKGHPLSQIERFQKMGLEVFGESYVQEWLDKISEMAEQPMWHYIGRLQTNKLRRVVETGALIQTVCTIKHLSHIQRHSESLGRVSSCLLQVHLGDEESKAGAAIEQIGELVSFANGLSNVRVLGLMTLPPRGDFGTLRNYFKRLHRAGVKHFGAEVELSMGMSGDLEAAMSQGATMIRIGTALFGARD